MSIIQRNISKPLLSPISVVINRCIVSISPNQEKSHDVFHDRNKNIFYLYPEKGSDVAAELHYRMVSSKTIDFFHTETPEPHRGKRLAKFLVKAGIDFATSQKYKIIPTCSYVQKYMDEELN